MAKKDRKKELEKIVGAEKLSEASVLIEEILFIEKKLEELKKLPFIRINPKDPAKQKSTPAARQYREMVQQYNNSLKLLLKISGDLGEVEEDSPLRQWVRMQNGEE